VSFAKNTETVCSAVSFWAFWGPLRLWYCVGWGVKLYSLTLGTSVHSQAC